MSSAKAVQVGVLLVVAACGGASPPAGKQTSVQENSNPTGFVAGRILSSGDGKPVAGAIITTFSDGSVSASSESNGLYKLVPRPLGNYTRVDVRFDEAAPDEGVVDAADPLARRTMLAAGRLEDGTPYDLSLAFDEDARFEDPAGLAIPEEVGALLLWLDVSAWFTALPLAECRQDGDLEMVNDRLQLAEGRGSCSDVENHLKEQIKRSGQLDRDD